MNRTVLFVTSVAFALAAFGQQKSTKPVPPPFKSATDSQLYRNPAYAFRYQIPYGWVDRTEKMRSGEDGGKSEVLLAVFERPPEVAGEGVNSGVVIATEDAAAYPGLKTAQDFLGPLNEVTAAQGFKPSQEPSEVVMGGRKLVRADFTKSLSDKVMMYQSTLVLMARGHIVLFTFIGGTADEVDELVERLEFGGRSPAPGPPSKR